MPKIELSKDEVGRLLESLNYSIQRIEDHPHDSYEIKKKNLEPPRTNQR